MLNRILDRANELFPENKAILFEQTDYSYAELKQITDRLATSLLGLGIRPNDRVAVFMFNRPEMMFCYYACFKIGATMVPINYRLKAPEFEYIVKNSQPKALISEKSLYNSIHGKLANTPDLSTCYLIDWELKDGQYAKPFAALFNPGKKIAAFPEKVDDTVAAVIHTSGTTGNPKGTILTQRQLYEHAIQHAKLVNYNSDDKTLLCLALCCNFGFTHQMLPAAYTGAAVEVIPVFDARKVLTAIQEHNITLLYMMPVMYNELINEAAKQQSPITNKLRLCVVAGDVTPSPVFNQFYSYFGLDLCEGLGMTETQVYALNPVGARNKIGSVGPPVDHLQVEIQNDQGQSLPVNEVGEIAVKGRVVTEGYLNDPHATAKAFRNGWFLTGDLGCFDQDGYLWFKARKKQLIIHGGSNISPQEVEEAFYQNPAVLEAAVVGIPDQKWGEIVKAYVVLKPGSRKLTERDLLLFVRPRLANYKIPDRVEFVARLPKGATGKLDRRRLRNDAIKLL